MKLLFNNTDFYVVIGTNTFDNIEGVAVCVIEYVVHSDLAILESALAQVGVTVEVSFDSEERDSRVKKSLNDELDSEAHVNKRLTLESTGAGKLDTNDSDRLHLEWLKAFDNILRPTTIQYWKSKIGKVKDYNE